MTENNKTKIIRLEQLSSFKDFQDSLHAKLSIITSLVTLAKVSTISLEDNPEWKVVYLDNEDKVLFGVKQDNTWELNADVNDIIDCILSSYTTT